MEESSTKTRMFEPSQKAKRNCTRDTQLWWMLLLAVAFSVFAQWYSAPLLLINVTDLKRETLKRSTTPSENRSRQRGTGVGSAYSPINATIVDNPKESNDEQVKPDTSEYGLRQKETVVDSVSSSIHTTIVDDPQENNHEHFKPDANGDGSRQKKTEVDSKSSSMNATIIDDLRESNHSVGENSEKHFVKYWLEYDKPYKITYGPFTQCEIGTKFNKHGRKPITRAGLSEPLSKILNVTTYVQTNLKIVTVGDSVAMQFHQVLEEAFQPPPTTNSPNGDGNNQTYQTLYQFAWGAHESVSVSAPVRGGGALAALRMTGLLLEEGKGKPPPNAGPNQNDASGGWLPEHIQQILDHKYNTTTTMANGSGEIATTTTTTTHDLNSFDVMLFRIPHGWLPASIVTRERLEKSLLLARELFGVRTIIIQTLFLNNNVKTISDLNQMRLTNAMIRDLVQASWQNPDFPDLLLMDFGGWTDELTELNARLAGMDTTSSANYTLARLGCAKFPPSIAMACAEKNVTQGVCQCTRNVISIDGMHWCMETMGGRIVAVTSCLLRCSLLIDDDANQSTEKKRQILGKCQEQCNDQFMSLREASALVTDTTIMM